MPRGGTVLKALVSQEVLGVYVAVCIWTVLKIHLCPSDTGHKSLLRNSKFLPSHLVSLPHCELMTSLALCGTWLHKCSSTTLNNNISEFQF